MTQKHIMLAGQKAVVPMCRKSSWTDASYNPPTPAWEKSAQIAADYGIAIAKPQAIAIGQIRDLAGEVMNIAIRDGRRSAIQAEADKAARKSMRSLQNGKRDGLFRLYLNLQKLNQSDQLAPLKAEGLHNLGTNFKS